MGAPMFRVRTLITGSPGGSYLSTFYFDATGPLTAQNAATAARTFWNSIRLHISNNLTITPDLAVYTLDETTGSPTGVSTVTGAAITGGATADEEAWATQGLVEWRTGNFLTGREIRGRTFIPGVCSGDSSGGVPTGTYPTDLQTAAAALIADANSTLVVWSRKNGFFDEVTSSTVWNKWAVLRSRRD